MIKYTVLLVALVFSSASARADTTSPDILNSVSSDHVSLLSSQETSETRGESIDVFGTVDICALLGIPFCNLSQDFDLEIFSTSVPLPFGLGTVYLQQ